MYIYSLYIILKHFMRGHHRDRGLNGAPSLEHTFDCCTSVERVVHHLEHWECRIRSNIAACAAAESPKCSLSARQHLKQVTPIPGSWSHVVPRGGARGSIDTALPYPGGASPGGRGCPARVMEVLTTSGPHAYRTDSNSTERGLYKK